MAPRKRLLREEAEPGKPDDTKRVTRSVARKALFGEPEPEPAPKLKKRKAVVVKEGGKDAQKESVSESEEPTVDNPEEAQRVAVAAVGKKEKAVIIEHCKQCNSFKTRAFQVKNGLEAGVRGITVLVNPEKPRRGCFEIREEDGEKFVSLLDMKRPFKPMKELDMETVISNIVGKLNGEE